LKDLKLFLVWQKARQRGLGEPVRPKGYTQCGGFCVGRFPHKTRLAISASRSAYCAGNPRCPKGYTFGYRNWRGFPHERLSQEAFPQLVSYNRFVELMPWSMMLLCYFLQTRKGEVTGISFIDSTPIDVCSSSRSYSHRVFKGLVRWSKNLVAWHYGFKLHLIINDKGELLAFKLTSGNTDDRQPVRDLTSDIIGKLFGDRGYISHTLFEQLYEQGLKLITRRKMRI
jgi:hypothetical protein